MKDIRIVGAGLAGSEAAWQAARRGCRVALYEMRPAASTPAHKTGDFAELVCSNSLRAEGLANAVGVLKAEMRRLDSLIMSAADATAIPAGGALAVDRTTFAQTVTERLTAHPNVTVAREEVTAVPFSEDSVTVVATGPLTAGAIAADIARHTGDDASGGCYFYDAAAPIVTRESVDMTRAYFASRYGKGDDNAYLNCPMTCDEYDAFYKALISAEVAAPHLDEPLTVFEGCMPVEVMAGRGQETLLFGPLKPVGLEDPRTGERPYAVVQLRQDNAAATLYNLVGFQTHLKWPEQRRVFSMIPALARAEFVRYGVMHRNTYINSPHCLLPTLQLRAEPRLLFAGQMTGVEGYVESASSGLVAGINAARLAAGESALTFPPETAHGALCHYITTADAGRFQPMNVNFGLMPPLGKRLRGKQQRRAAIGQRALESLETFIAAVGRLC